MSPSKEEFDKLKLVREYRSTKAKIKKLKDKLSEMEQKKVRLQEKLQEYISKNDE